MFRSKRVPSPAMHAEPRMPASAMRFAVAPSVVGWLRFSAWGCVMLAVLNTSAILFYAGPEWPPKLAGHVLLAGISIFLAALAWGAFRQLGQIRFSAIAVDADGLWPAHLPKDRHLVRWEGVKGMRERPFLQRLDLLDASGNVLLKLEYQLVGFDLLRAVVAQRAHLSPENRSR